FDRTPGIGEMVASLYPLKLAETQQCLRFAAAIAERAKIFQRRLRMLLRQWIAVEACVQLAEIHVNSNHTRIQLEHGVIGIDGERIARGALQEIGQLELSARVVWMERRKIAISQLSRLRILLGFRDDRRRKLRIDARGAWRHELRRGASRC